MWLVVAFIAALKKLRDWPDDIGSAVTLACLLGAPEFSSTALSTSTCKSSQTPPGSTCFARLRVSYTLESRQRMAARSRHPRVPKTLLSPEQPSRSSADLEDF